MLNSEVSMTKDAYFEMCRQLGEEPIESEIPLELEDFPDLVQSAFIIYGILSDNWDPMGGNYLGKDYSLVFNLFDLYNIEQGDRLLCLNMLQHMDGIRSKSIADKLKQKTPTIK